MVVRLIITLIKPIFVDVLNRPLKTAVISNNTCKNEIKLENNVVLIFNQI